MVFYGFFWVQKGLEKRRKQTRIRGKSNNKNKYLWFDLLYIKKYILLENLVSKKRSLYHQILFSFFTLQDIWNAVMIHQNSVYINKQITTIEIYINRLSTTIQILLAMDFLILMSEKYLHFRKRQKHFARKLLPTP